MYAAKEYARLKQRLEINQYKLDDELIQAAPDMQNAAEFCAAAMKLRDAATRNLELAKTEAGVALRKVDDRISEAKIAALIPADGIVQDCYEALDVTKHDAAVWQSLVKAYEEKGSSLRRICDMTMAGFLTPPAVRDRLDKAHAVRPRL